MGSDDKLGRRMGCMVPHGPGIFEIHYMGRRMKVHVNRDTAGDLKVFGVPGHLEEGIPVEDFDGFVKPRIDDSRRSAVSNLLGYDRDVSRVVAGLAALRAAVTPSEPEKVVPVSDEIIEQCGGSYLERVVDRAGVLRAVRERLDVWSIEDRDGIPLPSYGPGAPPEGKDVNGRDV